MTEVAYIAADIALLAIPSNVAFSFYGFVGGNILTGIHDKYSPERIQEIQQIFISRYGIIRKFLLDEKYIEVVNYSIPQDVLTDKGKKAQELGGHKEYKAWEAEQVQEAANEKRRQEKLLERTWPERNWKWMLAMSAIIFPVGTGILLEAIRKEPTHLPQPIQVVRDTVYIYRPDTVKPKEQPPDSMPK